MTSTNVFVVHGRNLAARDAMFTFLRALGLNPFEWSQAESLTRKEASTLEIVKAGIEHSQCTVVLLTGDDMSRLRPELGHESHRYQPRPNVFFEAGWAMARGGQEKTIFVSFGALREFSDLSGINTVEIDNSPASRISLAQLLKNAGCQINEDGLDYLRPEAGGNFERAFDETQGYEVLERGGFTDFVVDSSLSQGVNNINLHKELCDSLVRGEFAGLKFNYLGVNCAQNWLALSQDPAYGHSELVRALDENAPRIVQASDFMTREVDFISLGPGDGVIDLGLLHAFQKNAKLKHYYPIDISLELLQVAVHKVVSTDWLPKTFRIKAVHGDFTRLSRYKPIYGFDSAPKIFSLVGYSLGNYNETDLIGRLREGMELDDLLLLDARLHHLKPGASSSEQKEITTNYKHALNNNFAFGPLEAATFAEFKDVEFLYEVHPKFTAVPDALNVITYCEKISTRMRRNNKKVYLSRLDLAVTTLYDAVQLESWLQKMGFKTKWRQEVGKTLIMLLRKSD